MNSPDISVLAIDTSGSLASAACMDSKGHIYSTEGSKNLSHIEELPQLVHSVLEQSKAKEALKALLIGSGPGSFTGLRIGFSYAKGYAMAREIPLIGLPSMKAAAMFYRQEARFIVTISDARREEVFFVAYQCHDNRLSEIDDVKIIPVSDIEKKVFRYCNEYGYSADEVLIVSETENLSPSLGYRITVPGKVATGLLELARLDLEEIKPYSLSNLSSLSPEYVRSVAARTIKERAQIANI